VLRIEVSKSAALGAALQAAHGWLTAAGKIHNGKNWSPVSASRFLTAKSARTKRPRGFTTSCWKIRRVRMRGAG